MSIKELFDKTKKNTVKAANIDFGELVSGSNVESAKQVSSYFKEASKVVPPINYGDPASFARFGTAAEYYKNSVNHIQQTYPYDGSSHEKSQWHLTASNLDNWIFDNVYPRTTGHAIFSPENTTTTQKSSDGYGNPSTKEYITFFGGPHKDPSNTKLKDMFPSLGGTANIYKATQKRESNLKFDLSNSGVTVEFWLKKPFVSGSDKEVVFDMWNQATSSVAGIQRSDYGRLRIEITGAAGTTSPFLVTAISGTTGFQRAPIGSTLSAATLSDNEWKQFSFTFKNNGSNVNVELYQNGKLIETVTTGSSLSPVTGAMKAQLGSLLTEVSGTHSFGGTPDFRGWGKLSGSIDEFRYWKTKRNSKQIGGNWFTQVNGGTNTDTANTDLGVYYKFNEGVLGSGSTDSTVLDYSGRITNGTWTGYSAGYSRSLISALTTYNSDFNEFKDPIIYSSHPDVVDLKQQLRQTGSVHDLRNSSRMIGMIPSWIFEEEQDKDRTVTKDMLQVVSSYFDELSTYISYLPKIKDQNYISSSHKPLPFAGRLLTNYGFDYSELFQNSTAIEEILNKNEDVPFSEKVHNIKNFLYTNIYNNLTQIYKAKGTTSAIRNLLHCMGIDEDLIKINTYADNVTYEIRDNVMDTAVYSRLADFNHAQRHGATVYQYTSSADSESTSFISGSGTAYKEMEGQGFTFESEILFPRKPDVRTAAYEDYDYPYLTASLFGMHTAQMQSPADTTWAGNGTTGDYANFQVYALRDSIRSSNAKFVLTGTSGGPIPLLTSSLYKDVYDDSRWNFAVRVVPTKHPLATLVAETSASTTGMEDSDFYNVEFYGVNYISDIINHEFHVSGTVKRKHIKNFMSAPKRTYVGAHYTNFTSSLLQRSDVRVQSFRAWAEYLDNAVLKAHARDVNNYGTLSPYQNTALFDASSQNNEIPQFANLMLHWNFDTLTGSNASGQFLVPDLTSGSSTYTSRYCWISGLLGNMHSGRGDFFGANDDGAVDVDWLPSLKQLPLESINSDDNVKILNDTDDKVFTQDSRPINHYFSIEKSMYQSISEEMINIFGTMKDFHNLIGQPVNRYRMNYKAMEKLRSLFFERVQNTPDLDKYVNYFKWFDGAIGTMIANLIPASAKFSPEVNTVIESHALERNKYWNKFPTLEAKTSDPEASIVGPEELGYNWKFGHAPVSPDQDTNQDENCLWWNQRAERNDPLSSGVSAVDSDKGEILNAATTQISGSTYAKRALSRPYKLVTDRLNSLKPESKKYENKKKDFYKALTRPGNLTSLNIPISEVKNVVDCSDAPTPDELKKTKLSYKAGSPDTAHEYLSGKGDMFTPFTIFSASSDGYTKQLETFKPSIEINNMHQDTYGNMPAPMQGPFTEKHVGGAQHRHAPLNYWNGQHKTGSSNTNNLDGFLTRAESFNIVVSSTDLKVIGPDGVDNHGPHRQRATYYRDQTAKRPLNIKNIKMTASSPTKIGNYDHRYQYFHTSGRDKNNLWFRSGSTGLGGFAQPTAEASAISGVIDFTLPDRSTLEDGSRNQTVFVERFSAPGGAEVQSRGYLDTESETYSVYNALPYRNLMVRTNLDKWNKHHSAFGGYDGVYGIPTASYHKIYRNGRFRIEQSGGVFITASVYDNGFIQRPIPQSDANYAWISASLLNLGDSGMSLFGYAPYDGKFYSSSYYFATASDFGGLGLPGSYKVGFGISSRDVGGGQWTANNLTNFKPVDFAGLNRFIFEPITSSMNLLGWPLAGPNNQPIGMVPQSPNQGYLNVSVAALGHNGYIDGANVFNGNVTAFNALILNRQGPYGWPSWKQIRGAQHPVVRSQKKNNILSINHISQQAVGSEPVYSLFHYTESALTVNRPLTHTLRVKDNIDQEFGGDGVGGTQQLVLRSTFGNSQQTFNNPDLKKKLGQIFRINEDTTYDKLLPYYGAGSAFINIPDESNPVDAFDNLKYSEIIYPRNKHMYLNIVRDRERFSVEYWRNDRTRRNEEFKLNSQGYTIHKQSIWPLDARNNFDTAATLEASSFNSDSVATGSEGELQNKYSVYHNGVHTRISASALYNRPIEEVYAASSEAYASKPRLFAGDTLWEAGAGSSLNAPFYESYSDYAEDLRAAGKEYSIIPEFRISEHIQYYAKDKGGDFLADNPGFLTLTGSSITSSQMTDFYRTYSTTDFLKHFQLIRNDHNGVARAGEITLKCNALMKFLPYEGFYPAQRTKQMSTLFSQSYGSTLKTAGTQKNFRTAMAPFYAPGIMYNSIKSGIAVDWPAHSASFEVANQSGSTPSTLGIPRINERFHYRVPFESILAPEVNLANQLIVDCEPHVSANIDCTASFAAPSDPLYSMAAHNFFAEVPKFFLKGQGLTTIASKSDFKSYMVEENNSKNPRIYSMIISLSHAELRTRAEIVNAINPMGSVDNYASWYKNPPTSHNYIRTNRTGALGSIPTSGDQRSGKDGYDRAILPTEMRHGSSFGPAVQVSGNLCAANNIAHEYSPYTPPYYDGYAELEYVFTPTFAGAHSLSDILAGLEFRDFRMGTSNLRCAFGEAGTSARSFDGADPGSFMRYMGVNNSYLVMGSAAGIALDHAMPFSSSINHAQIASLKNVKYDVLGNPVEISDPNEAIIQLAIQPKWECPILDFKDVVPSYPAQGSGSVSRGMWHQKGKVPTKRNGVFMTVSDSPHLTDQTGTRGRGGMVHGTGSLADLLGIEKKAHRLGELAQTKTVREAIVAIPYIRSSNGDMNFYSVSRQAIKYILGDVNAINAGITPGKSLYDMVEKMQRYILPPQLDFVKNTTVDPFAMYIFEFSHTFNREDLANIWQNLPPESLLSIKEPKESTATISHALLADEIFGLGVDDDLTKMGDKTQWLVFKVKQKAETNYYAMTADTLDDQKFKFAFNQGQDTIEKAPEYSYNWPYDYFTMVEMAKMEVETKFEPGTDFVPGTKIADLDGGSPMKAVQPGPTKGGAKVIEQGGPNDAQVLKDKFKHPGSTKTGNAPGQGGGPGGQGGPGFGGDGGPFG